MLATKLLLHFNRSEIFSSSIYFAVFAKADMPRRSKGYSKTAVKRRANGTDVCASPGRRAENSGPTRRATRHMPAN